MASGRDDDALTWDGDDDPTLSTGASARTDDVVPAREAETAETVPLADGYTAVGKGSDTVGLATTGPSATTARDEARPPGNVALVALGVLGGMYLLFTIGWIIGGLRLNSVAVFLVSPAASIPALWLAVLAPALWFVTVLLLTRRSASWLRFTLLGAGILLLVPWPFIMLGAVGS